MAFAEVWKELQSRLTVGAIIANWTANRGLIGDPFIIVEVTETHIVVDTPGAKRLQPVPIADFEAIYDCWSDYCHRAKLRSDFKPLTRYSKYVISILHCLESELGGHLP